MSILFTNKQVVQITPSETFWNLLVASKEHPGYTKEFTLNNSGYYLIDRIGIGDGMAELSKVFTKAFEQELVESGVPRDAWPSTSEYEVCKAHFKVNLHPLIADLGREVLETGIANA